jgi:hypothetical protein
LHQLTECDPKENFQYVYIGGNWAEGPGSTDVGITSSDYPDIVDIGDCCAKCRETLGCIYFTLHPHNYCTLWVTSGGSATVADNTCPLGYYAATDVEYNSGGGTWGLGPCGGIES